MDISSTNSFDSHSLEQFVLDFLHEKETPAHDPVFKLLQGDGSKRTFWRVLIFSPDRSLIAMANPAIDAPSIAENNAYLRIGEHLRAKGIPIPEIYHFDLQKGWFLMEDMGKISLQDYALSTNNPMPAYKKVLRNLISLQIKGAEGFQTRWCCQTERYDRKVMLQYEANYFTRAFLHGYLHLKNECPELNPSFEYLAETASKSDNSFFMH